MTKAIDWQKCLDLTNHQAELAKKILRLFNDELPLLYQSISQAYQNKNYQQLEDQIHKLHGSCCYCGALDLQQLVSQIENDLKSKNYASLPQQMDKFDKEVERVLIELSLLIAA